MKIKFNLILALLVISFTFENCKREKEEKDPYRSSFTLNGAGQRYYTPVAYVRKEGYDPKKKIYYLSLTFPTNGVYIENTYLKGYGEAVQIYFWAPSQSEIPVGKYKYNVPLDTSNLFFQINTINTYTNNYNFTTSHNQKGIRYTKTKGGVLNVSKNGETYDITYGATMTKKDVNLKDFDFWYAGDYKGKIVFP